MPPELTLEQQFQFRTMQQAVDALERSQLLELLIDATRQLSIKTNVLMGMSQGKQLCPKMLELSMEQSLKTRIMEQELQNESKKDLANRLLETMQLIMAKDNAVKEIMSSCRW